MQKNKANSNKNLDLISQSLAFCEKCKIKIKSLLQALGVFKQHKEKGVDVKIAVDLIKLADENAFDIAILLSGDADLSAAVEYVVQNKNKKVINAFFEQTSSSELRNKSSSCFKINQNILQECKK